jgi:hypothetical protein
VEHDVGARRLAACHWVPCVTVHSLRWISIQRILRPYHGLPSAQAVHLHQCASVRTATVPASYCGKFNTLELLLHDSRISVGPVAATSCCSGHSGGPGPSNLETVCWKQESAGKLVFCGCSGILELLQVIWYINRYMYLSNLLRAGGIHGIPIARYRTLI